MLLATNMLVADADEVIDACKKTVRKFPDWAFESVTHYGTHRSLVLRYVGTDFSGIGLTLSLLRTDRNLKSSTSLRVQ